MAEGKKGGVPPVAPQKITCLMQSKALELDYGDAGTHRISFALLRASSPAAGGKKDIAQCKDVTVLSIDQVGNYAIMPIFGDGHKSGIYTWDLLAKLCERERN